MSWGMIGGATVATIGGAALSGGGSKGSKGGTPAWVQGYLQDALGLTGVDAEGNVTSNPNEIVGYKESPGGIARSQLQDTLSDVPGQVGHIERGFVDPVEAAYPDYLQLMDKALTGVETGKLPAEFESVLKNIVETGTEQGQRDVNQFLQEAIGNEVADLSGRGVFSSSAGSQAIGDVAETGGRRLSDIVSNLQQFTNQARLNLPFQIGNFQAGTAANRFGTASQFGNIRGTARQNNLNTRFNLPFQTLDSLLSKASGVGTTATPAAPSPFTQFATQWAGAGFPGADSMGSLFKNNTSQWQGPLQPGQTY